MYAVRIYEPGGPEALSYEEVDTPEPAAGMVRIKVRAAGVNHREIWQRQGLFGAFAQPQILGSDAAGEVDRLGVGVGRLEEGQRVVINPGLSCGLCSACLAGDQPACARFGLVGGAYAEYMVVPERNVVAMPSGLTFVEAASLGIPFVTAEAAFAAADVRPGQVVVLWGASGGLGMAALQLAKVRGARVVSVTRSAQKQEVLKKFRSDEVLIWDGSSALAPDVQRLTAGRGADVVMDSLGETTFNDSLAMCRRGGVVISVGATTGGKVALELGEIFRRRLTVIGAFLGSSSILPRILPLFARGQLMPVIDHVYPLEQADQAHEQLERGDVVGKVVLEV